MSHPKRLAPLTDRFQLTVECHPSVERDTIRSPRDIRTLLPS